MPAPVRPRRLLPPLVVLIGALALAGMALAAVSPTISPRSGTTRTPFKVSFVADRNVSGYQWYSVEVRGPREATTCEYLEGADITHARRGRTVSVVLRPIDRRRWCTGRYRGEVYVVRRVPCGQPTPEEGHCYRARTLAVFAFRVR